MGERPCRYIMAKVITREYDGELQVRYFCPGCGHHHWVPAKRWNWNGDKNSPTLSPSVRHFVPAGENRPEHTICHYHIRQGRIEYCGDCEHELKGQKIDLPEVEPLDDWT